MIHPFHPLYGREFDLLYSKQDWGEDRVFFHDDKGQVRSLPASWTDVPPVDPFITIAAGRALFRLQDLLELTQLVDTWKQLPKLNRV